MKRGSHIYDVKTSYKIVVHAITLLSVLMQASNMHGTKPIGEIYFCSMQENAKYYTTPRTSQDLVVKRRIAKWIEGLDVLCMKQLMQFTPPYIMVYIITLPVQYWDG